MKKVKWLGDSLDNVKKYPSKVKQEVGYNLEKIQLGLEPADWKPMSSIGKGAYELRIHDEREYRVFYVTKFEEAIYILHGFVKKTQKTSQKDIDLGKQRYSDMMKMRRTK